MTEVWGHCIISLCKENGSQRTRYEGSVAPEYTVVKNTTTLEITAVNRLLLRLNLFYTTAMADMPCVGVTD